MDLLSRLTEDMKIAMKSGQKDRLMVIRMLLGDVKNIDLNPQKPTAEEAVAAYGKKLRKSVEEYEKLGRAGEVAKLREEIAVVDEYLPKKLSAEETATRIDAFLAQNSFNAKQMGQAMGMFMKQNGNEVDPGTVSKLMKERLK